MLVSVSFYWNIYALFIILSYFTNLVPPSGQKLSCILFSKS